MGVLSDRVDQFAVETLKLKAEVAAVGDRFEQKLAEVGEAVADLPQALAKLDAAEADVVAAYTALQAIVPAKSVDPSPEVAT